MQRRNLCGSSTLWRSLDSLTSPVLPPSPSCNQLFRHLHGVYFVIPSCGSIHLHPFSLIPAWLLIVSLSFFTGPALHFLFFGSLRSVVWCTMFAQIVTNTYALLDGIIVTYHPGAVKRELYFLPNFFSCWQAVANHAIMNALFESTLFGKEAYAWPPENSQNW